jgi:hypothetical protein
MSIITKEIYDSYVEKSFFTEKNFSGKYAPKFLSANMIPSSNLKQFYYQTAFLVNLYSSLFIELKKYENTISNNIVKFTKAIENLQIELDSTCFTGINSCSSGTYNLSYFDTTSYLFKFYYKTFEQHFKTGGSQSYLYAASGITANASNAYTTTYSTVLAQYAPIFTDQAFIADPSDVDDYLTFNKNISLGSAIIISKKDIQNIPKNKIADEIRQILLQEPENILGFLLYKKLYYNIILYNISIQNVIRKNYLNDNTAIDGNSAGNILNISRSIVPSYGIDSLNTNCIKIGGTCPSGLNTIIKNKVTEIYNSINSNISNITTLNEQHFINNNEDNRNFLMEKNKYKNKIISLNTLRDEYIKTQDKLNISSKLYNQQLKNYNSIKTYATYIIIILIIIILFIISISIFPVFSKNTNNAIYIIALIILIVITFLYYTNFKYVNLYENFTSISMTVHPESGNDLPIIYFNATNNIDNKIHAAVYNSLQAKMNEYINAYTDLLNNIRVNINTVGSKTFSQDANIYLYNLYLEKKRQVEFNRIKLTNLFNMIEVIKKQINYLFNIIFAIACFSIIILIALVLYSTTPELYIFIIILCIVLITILMIYFAYAIIQPTRMIANKNYWASLNPSKNVKSFL